MTKLGYRKCHSCCEFFDAGDEFRYPDGGALKPDAGILCPMCYDEDETLVTVHIFEPDGAETTYDLGNYQAMQGTRSAAGEEWDFDSIDQPTGWTARWHSTDGWRGYYNIIAPDELTLVRSDAIYDLTGDELAAFDEKLREVCGDLALTVARVTSRTSNVFSTGGDWYVQAPKELAEQLVRDLVR